MDLIIMSRLVCRWSSKTVRVYPILRWSTSIQDEKSSRDPGRVVIDIRSGKRVIIPVNRETLMIGKTVSHYKILEELGRGGMGVVYRAEDTKLDRIVALKFLAPRAIGGEEDRARFLHEAKAEAALSHPNICTIHEIDEVDGRPFIAMQYVEGQDLGERIGEGPLRISEAADIALQAAAGLQEAHEKDIVHRDIKPANIMINKKGRVKIMDFGLAKALGRTMLTRADSTLGTYAYMSPEQSRGDDVDCRTDIWSLGVVLYEMITGRLPFRGDYEQAVVYSIITEEPEPVTALRTGVPMELERVVSKCLRKDPDRRYQDMADLAADLKQADEDLSIAGRSVSAAEAPPRKARNMRWPWVAVAALIVVAAALVVPKYYRSLQGPGPLDGRKMLVVLPFENLGSPEDEYFAAGMTEEITSRLAAVSGLGVISRTSAVQYGREGKTLRQIGDDLGVDYVLEGTVRWNKGAAGGSRVRVTPQLIQVSDDTHLWAETYDRVIEDIFAVQSEIAEKIIGQLGVTMLDRERDLVEAKPTENLLAYETYLRGNDYLFNAGAVEERWGKAETLLRQAVELDPEFALAYAKLSVVHSEYYFWGFDRTPERLEKAKAAADRALEIDPSLPEGYSALGSYYYTGRQDFEKSLHYHSIAARGMPNNPKEIESIAYIWRRQGLLKEALEYLEKAAVLAPGQYWYQMQMGITNILLRKYEEADRYFARSLELEPDQVGSYSTRWLNESLRTGNPSRTRTILESVPPGRLNELAPIFYMQRMFERDPGGALDELGPMPKRESFFFGRDLMIRDLLEGTAYRMMGDTSTAYARFDSARVILKGMTGKTEGDRLFESSLRSCLGRAYAGLGRKEDAFREGERAIELVSWDKLLITYRIQDMTEIFILFGEYDAAMDRIEHLLSVPSFFSIHFLEISPKFDPIRELPRYKRIVRKYSDKSVS
jgi:non-specific serine/threonine protein kinase